MAQLNVYKVTSLPGSPNSNSIYLVKGASDTEVAMFVTDTSGTARPLSSTPLLTAGSTSVGAVRYSGISPTDGQFYGGSIAPSNSTRLNYDGDFRARVLSGGANTFYSSASVTVSTSSVQISPISTVDGGLHLVNGVSGGNEFTELVMQGSSGVSVVSTRTSGSPSARTYGISGGRLTLSMASGTYTVTISTIANETGVF